MNQESRIPKVASWRNRQANGKELSDEYLEYMKSDAWRDLRNRKYRENGYRCQSCGVRYNNAECLEVHHTHYDNFTLEDTSDLLVLCHLCHDVIGMIRDMRKTQYRIVDPHIKAFRLEASLGLDHIEDFVLRFEPDAQTEDRQRYDLFKEHRTKIIEFYGSIGWGSSGPSIGLEYNSFLESDDGKAHKDKLTKLCRKDEETTVEEQEETTVDSDQGFHQRSSISIYGDDGEFRYAVFADHLEAVSERIRQEVDRNSYRFGKIGRNRLSDIALGDNGVDLDAEELFNLIKSLKTESGEVLGTIKRTKDMPLTWRTDLSPPQDFNHRLLYLAVHGHVGLKTMARGSRVVGFSFIRGCLERETVEERGLESLRLKTDERLKTVLNKKETSAPPPKEEETKPKSRMPRWLTFTKDLMFNTFRLKYK